MNAYQLLIKSSSSSTGSNFVLLQRTTWSSRRNGNQGRSPWSMLLCEYQRVSRLPGLRSELLSKLPTYVPILLRQILYAFENWEDQCDFTWKSGKLTLFLSGFRSFLTVGGETGSDFSLLCFRSSLGEVLRSLLRFLAESKTRLMYKKKKGKWIAI